MYLCSCSFIFFVCMITVAANLQKIVEEPQSNRSVTFKLVFTPLTPLQTSLSSPWMPGLRKCWSLFYSFQDPWLNFSGLTFSLSEACNPDLLISPRKIIKLFDSNCPNSPYYFLKKVVLYLCPRDLLPTIFLSAILISFYCYLKFYL